MKKIRLMKKIGVLFLLSTALAVGGCGKKEAAGISDQPILETQAPAGDEGALGEENNTGNAGDGAEAGQETVEHETAGQETTDTDKEAGGQETEGPQTGNAGNGESGSETLGAEGAGSEDHSQASGEDGDATAQEQPEEKTAADNGKMRDSLTATQVAKEMGVGINLGNTMEAFWEDKGNATSHAQFIGANKPSNYETCWGARVTTQEIIDGMKAEGFQTVRIPVYWGNMMKDDKTFQLRAPLLGRVKAIVD